MAPPPRQGAGQENYLVHTVNAGSIEITLDADHPVCRLPVITNLATKNSAVEVRAERLRADAGNSGRSERIVFRSRNMRPTPADVAADVEASPAIDWRSHDYRTHTLMNPHWFPSRNRGREQYRECSANEQQLFHDQPPL